MGDLCTFSEDLALARELIGFGKALGLRTVALAVEEEAAGELAGAGADEVILIDDAASPIESSARGIAKAIESEGFSIFAVGATPCGRELAAKVAGHMDCAMASDIAGASLDGDELRIARQLYGGSVIEDVLLPLPCVVTIGKGKWEASDRSGQSRQRKVSIERDERVSVVETAPVAKQGADLRSAKRIVSIGMGIQDQGDLAMVGGLADKLDAPLGCTRGIAEERRWLPVEQYVGLSGVTVSPDLYLTLGVSGQVQHMVGARDSKVIAAIDKNENAPIFKSCDYGIVGDLYEIVPLLVKALG